MTYGSDHTHYGYADSGHGHSGYAADSHSHQGYELYDVASEHHEHMLSEVAGAAPADHDHDDIVGELSVLRQRCDSLDCELVSRANVADMLEAFRVEFRDRLTALERKYGELTEGADELVGGWAALEAKIERVHQLFVVGAVPELDPDPPAPDDDDDHQAAQCAECLMIGGHRVWCPHHQAPELTEAEIRAIHDGMAEPTNRDLEPEPAGWYDVQDGH